MSGANAAEIQAESCVQGLAAQATHAFGSVKKVSAGPLIEMTAGEELRLAGLVVPGVPRYHKDLDAANTAEAATAQLRTLVKAAKLSAAPSFKADRHGRNWAQLFVHTDGAAPGQWLQAAMVSSGHARVSPAGRGSSCSAALLKLEAEARRKQLGIWQQKRFAVLPAWATRKLRRRENSFQVIEGEVRAVAETKRFTYINFGKDWRTDFTATVSARTAKKLKQEGFSLTQLKDKKVRVRGWIRYGNGPMVRVSAREQIEVLEQEPDK